jgi:N-acetylmuramic acid 6-phosphate (MurNAc-6-P) etherase
MILYKYKLVVSPEAITRGTRLRSGARKKCYVRVI